MNLYNSLTGLGVEEQDTTLNDLVGWTRDLTLWELGAIWSGSGIAQRAVMTPVNDIYASGFTFSPSEQGAPASLGDDIDGYLEARSWPTARREAAYKARIFGGAATILHVQGEDELDQPLSGGALLSLEAFCVADRYELRPVRWSMALGKGYKRPELYQFFPRSPGAYQVSDAEFQAKASIIHASRVIPFTGLWVPENIAEGYARGWSDSVIRPLRVYLTDLARVHRSVAHLVVNIAERVVKDPSFWAKLDTMTEAELTADLRRRKLSASFNGERHLHPEATIEWTGPTVSGLADLVRETMVGMASTIGMPVEKLFGIAPPGGMDGAGDYVAQNYYDTLDAEREAHYLPAERRARDIVMLAKDGPTRGRPVAYKLIGNPLKRETALERANRTQAEGTAASTYVQLGALHPMEVRASLSKSEQDLWQIDPQYDEELAQGGQGLQLPPGADESMQAALAAGGGGSDEDPDGSPGGPPAPRGDSDDWGDDDDAVLGEMEEWAGSDGADEDDAARMDATKAGIDADRFVPPESVQKAARAALERRKAGQRGGLSSSEAGKQGIGSGVVRAAQLASGKAVSPRIARRINAFFGRFGRFKDAPLDSKGKQAYQLWGGAAAERWASALVDDMDEARMDAGEWTRFDAADWNEDLHPRAHGKFAKKGEGEEGKYELKKPLNEHSLEELQQVYQDLYGKPGNITNTGNLKTWIKKALNTDAEHHGKIAVLKEHYKDLTGKETGIPHEPQLKYAINAALKKQGKEPVSDWGAFYAEKAGAKPAPTEAPPEPAPLAMPELKSAVGEIAADPGLAPSEKTEAIDTVLAQHHQATAAQEGAPEAPAGTKALADMTPDELSAHLKTLDLAGLQKAYEEVHGVPTTTTTAGNLKTWIKQGLSTEHKAQVAHLQAKLEAITGKKTSVAKVPQLKHALNNALKAKGEAPITDWSELEQAGKQSAAPEPTPAKSPDAAPEPPKPRTKFEQLLDDHPAPAETKAAAESHIQALDALVKANPHLGFQMRDGGKSVVDAIVKNSGRYEKVMRDVFSGISQEQIDKHLPTYLQAYIEQANSPAGPDADRMHQFGKNAAMYNIDREIQTAAIEAKHAASREKLNAITQGRSFEALSDAELNAAHDLRTELPWKEGNDIIKEKGRREDARKAEEASQRRQKRLEVVPEERRPVHEKFLDTIAGELEDSRYKQHDAFKALPDAEQDKVVNAPRVVLKSASGKPVVSAETGAHNVGDYVRDIRGYYKVTGKGSTFAKDVPDAPDKARGESMISGDRPYQVGEVVPTRNGFVRVLSRRSQYIPEEGLSMGLSDDSGTLHSHIVRPATEEEAATLKQYQTKLEAYKAARKVLSTDIPAQFRTGERPADADPYANGNEKIPVDEGRTIYGGGQEYLIGKDKIWHIQGNGADGDDWSYNNISGAIAQALPRTPELERQIRDAHEVASTRPPVPTPEPLPESERGRGGNRIEQHQYHYVTPIQELAKAQATAPTAAAPEQPTKASAPAPNASEAFRFGKHSGRTLEQVWRTEPGYLQWAAANLNSEALRKKIAAFVAHKRSNP